MDLPRSTLLGTLAIALSFCRVSPLSTSSQATGTFRGSRGSSGTTATSSHTSSFRSSIRCRRQPHQHHVATAEATALVMVSANPLSVTGERTPMSGRSRRRRRQLGHLEKQHVRRQAALLCTSDGSSGVAPVAADEAAATATATETPHDASPPAPAKRGTLSSENNGGGVAAEYSSRGSGTTFREAFNGRLPNWLLTRLEELGFAAPTLVQRQALEVILGDEKYDAVLHAQTGSGKTLAFLLPLLALIDPSRSAVQGLVVVPTRELGLQVAGVAKRLAAGSGSGRDKKIQVMSVLEGSSNKRQRAWAWADPPHIVIGNPENLSRLVTTGAVRVNAVSYVVVDEVDACLLSEGTRSWLHELLARSLSPTHADEQVQKDDEEAARLVAVGAGRVTGAAAPVNKKVKDRQTVFASATVPQHNHFIRQCVQKQWTLTEPVHVQVHAKESMPPCLSHFYVVCPPEQKLAVLQALVRRELGVSAAAAAAASVAAAAEKLPTTTATASPGAAEKGQGGDQPSGHGGGGGGGAKAAADTRGLVFALPTKPLEAIATSLDKALGGGGGGVVGDGRSSKQQAKRNGGGGLDGPAPPPLAEFLLEELGLNARADTMSLFREGKTRLLVSTDMAARGLDVPEITHVFNLDLPLDGEGYVHRGGRAGRLGRPGKVISLVTPKQEFVIRRLGNGIGVDIKKISLGSSKRKRSPRPSFPEE